MGAAPPSLYPPSLPQAIMNKLWLGFDLRAAIAAPILHVNDKGQVEYEPEFSQVRPRSEPPLGGHLRAGRSQPPVGLSSRALPAQHTSAVGTVG